jgi:WD40 repeat protein
VASGGIDGRIILWRVSDGTELQSLPDYEGTLGQVGFSPDGSLLAASGGAGIKLWRTTDGALLWEFNSGGATVSFRFSPDGNTIALSGYGVSFARVSDGSLLPCSFGTLFGDDVPFAFSPDGSTVVGKRDQTVKLCQLADGKQLWSLTNSGLQRLEFSPDGKALSVLSGTLGHDQFEFRRVADAVLLVGVAANHDYPNFFAFAPDWSSLAVADGSEDGIKLWNVPDGLRLGTLTQALGAISVAYSPDGKTLAAGCGSKVKLWRIPGGELINTLAGHTGPVPFVVFSPDGSAVLSKGYDKTVSDDCSIPSTCYDRTARLWRVSNGALLLTVTNKTDVLGYSPETTFSPDGRLLVTSFERDSLRFWEVSTGAPLRMYDQDAFSVPYAAFSRNASLFAYRCGYTALVLARNPYAALSQIRLQLVPIGLLPDGPLQLIITGEAGRNYLLQASSDLSNWTNLTAFVSSNATSRITDSAWTNFNRRFYRLKQGP